MRGFPTKGDVFRHRTTGDVYTVVSMANIDATRAGWPPTILYEDRYERRWARPFADFNYKMQRVSPDEENP